MPDDDERHPHADVAPACAAPADVESSARSQARSYASTLTVHAQTDAPWVAAEIERALAVATEREWHDVRLALLHAGAVLADRHGLDSADEIIDAMEAEARRRDMRAVRAMALLDRFRRDVRVGAPPSFDDLASARVLLSDETQPPQDRVSGLINLAIEFDRLRLYDLADHALDDAARVATQLDDRDEAIGVIAHNRSTMLLFRAANHAMAGELDDARATVARFDALSPGADGMAVPEQWMALLAAHRRVVGATIDGDELEPAEAEQLAAQLSSIDGDLALLLELVTPMSSWSEPPRIERIQDVERLDLALFLHARALERAGAEPESLVAAVKRYAAFVTSRAWQSRTDLQNGVSAMIEARSLSNERRDLLHQATTDALTGLDNRRVFEHALEAESGREATLYFVDVDYLKTINDSHGHPVGDSVLRAAGRILADVAAPLQPDVVARVGGDEFAVLIVGRAAELRFADEFEIAMRRHDWALDVLGGTPTATVGSATGVCGDGLVTEADRDLYRKKAWRRQQSAVTFTVPSLLAGRVAVGPWGPPHAPRS